MSKKKNEEKLMWTLPIDIALFVLLVVMMMLTTCTDAGTASSVAFVSDSSVYYYNYKRTSGSAKTLPVDCSGRPPAAHGSDSDISSDPLPRPHRKPSTKRQRPRPQAKGNKAVKQTWRVFGVEVHPDRFSDAHDADVPIEERFLHPAVLYAVSSRLKLEENHLETGVRVVRRSLDARPNKRRVDGGTGPRFVYVLDVDVEATTAAFHRWKHQPGRMELIDTGVSVSKKPAVDAATTTTAAKSNNAKPRVAIVGAGPAGLFCALQLAATKAVTPILLERGQPVESRGKDIGALMHRRSLDSESNFAFGEGGAGTFSDGKLTTRIGRNSDAVRQILEKLVQYGAPETILVDGAPHLGTDNLVRLLRNMRSDLRKLGGEIRFGTKATGLVIENGVTKGVHYVVSRRAVERNMGNVSLNGSDEKEGTILADAVVLATGHSSRDMYEQLHAAGVQLEAKGFAVGFRVEHPQKLINKIQYGTEWGPTVVTGKKTTDSANREYFLSIRADEKVQELHAAKLPVPSYRLATEVFDGHRNRGVYSFCMCPGGQIVPASTDPEEVCVNGMSFSRRDSQWANSALVVTVAPDDEVLDPYRDEYGVLAGLAFQRDMERRASVLGGGNLTVPVQRLTDFMAGRPSTSAPSSSYRLGVRPAACHEIYPLSLVQPLRCALSEHFDKQMPGFLCEEGLLHAVETRTSSPVRISRDKESCQAIGAARLFPAGEGAGFAGGIVSAAVDGIVVAEAVLDDVLGRDRESQLRKAMKSGVGSFY